MKRLVLSLVLLMSVYMGYILNVQAEDATSDSISLDTLSYGSLIGYLKAQGDTVRGATENEATAKDLHDWFDRRLLELNQEYDTVGRGYRLAPLGIYKTKRDLVKQKTARWNFGAEYHYPLNTMNGSFKVWSHDFDSAGNLELYAKLFVGFGTSKIVDLDVEAASNFGVTLELLRDKKDTTKSNLFNLLAGFTAVYVNPEQGDDGHGFYLYGGNRMFLVKDMLSLDLKLGIAGWRGGFRNNSPPGGFIGAGLNVHSLVDWTAVASPMPRTFEVGLVGNVSLNTLGCKLLLPLRLKKGVSLAPVVEYGRELGTESYDNVIGVGAELRLFGDVRQSVLNPYVGFQQEWLTGGTNTSSGLSVYYGSRLYVGKGRHVALDANFGPTFWQSDIQNEYGLKDWMGRVGVVVSIGGVKEHLTARGAIVTRAGAWGTNAVDSENFERLTDDDLPKRDGEVRVYGLEEGLDTEVPRSVVDSCIDYNSWHPPCVTPPTDTVYLDTCPPPLSKVGDITDLKFFKINLDFGLDVDPLNTKAGLLNRGGSARDSVFIAVLFDNRNTIVKNLDSSNTLFHFVDLDSCQYFGYRWDSTLSRQPEFRELGPLGRSIGPAGQPYMGRYNEYVQPMNWLDKDTLLGYIHGKSVETEILRVISEEAKKKGLYPLESGKYRVGYVRYRENTLAKLVDYRETSSLGVTIMIGKDQDRKALASLTDRCGFELSPVTPDTSTKSEPLGDYYFSNHVKMEDVFDSYPFESDDVIVEYFDTCSVVLSTDQERYLDTTVVNRLKKYPGEAVCLSGYVDKIYCKYEGGDKYQLAHDRAESVADYLKQMGVPEDQIAGVKGIGFMDPPRGEGRDRCVIVRFVD